MYNWLRPIIHTMTNNTERISLNTKTRIFKKDNLNMLLH